MNPQSKYCKAKINGQDQWPRSMDTSSHFLPMEHPELALQEIRDFFDHNRGIMLGERV